MKRIVRVCVLVGGVMASQFVSQSTCGIVDALIPVATAAAKNPLRLSKAKAYEEVVKAHRALESSMIEFARAVNSRAHHNEVEGRNITLQLAEVRYYVAKYRYKTAISRQAWIADAEQHLNYVQNNRPGNPNEYAQWRMALDGAEADLRAARASAPDPVSTPCLSRPKVQGFVVSIDRFGVERFIMEGKQPDQEGYRDPKDFKRPVIS